MSVLSILLGKPNLDGLTNRLIDVYVAGWAAEEALGYGHVIKGALSLFLQCFVAGRAQKDIKDIFTLLGVPDYADNVAEYIGYGHTGSNTSSFLHMNPISILLGRTQSEAKEIAARHTEGGVLPIVMHEPWGKTYSEVTYGLAWFVTERMVHVKHSDFRRWGERWRLRKLATKLANEKQLSFPEVRKCLGTKWLQSRGKIHE